MKKLMLAFAATAAFVSVSSAVTTNEWFTGTVNSVSGGSWNTPTEGSVTTNSTTLALDEVDKFTFAATTPKSVSGAQDLKFSTGAKFSYSYDTLPAVDSSAKAGVVVVNNRYYVLEKDGAASPATNKWVDTGYTASLNDSVAVNVVVTNGNHALYTIGGNATLDKEVVAGDGTWGSVDYKGSGEIASLVGTTIEFGWPSPSGPIEVDPAWAAANGIDAAKFNSREKLSNGFSASESYILGLNTNETLNAFCKYKNGYFTANVSTKAKLADKVSYNVWIDGVETYKNVTFPTNCFDRSQVASERTIEIRPSVSDQDPTGTSQTIGVWSSTQVASNSIGYISIPYECAVSNALWNLFDESHTDYMYVYDADSGEWDTWSVNGSGTVWTFVPSVGHETPITTVLHPGQAVKIRIGDCGYGGKSKGFVHVGNKVARTSTAMIPNKYNLVGNPDRVATPLAQFAATDKIRTFAVAENGDVSLLPDVSYAKYGAKWYKVQLNGSAEEVTEIPSDVHGFYIYPAESSISWSTLK